MFFIILQLFLLNVASTKEEVVLKPVDPNAVANESLRMLCNVDLEPGTFDISNVKFSIVPRGKKDRYLKQNITIINRSTASITYLNLSTLYNDAYIICSIRNFSNIDFSDQQHIHVGYRPSVPEIIPSYKVRNWDKFIFKWHFKFRNPVYNTIYHAWYKNSYDLDFTRCKCLSKHECRECHIDDALKYVHSSGLLQFKVNGSNAVGNVTSETEEKNLYTLVQPQKIVILKVDILHRSAVVNLTFETSKKDARSFRIRLLITCGTSYKEAYGYDLEWASRDTRTLSSLPPHSNCSVALRSKPLLNRKYWSDWAIKSFESPDAVPLFSPSICHGCFEILPNSRDDHACGILLYFKPLEESESRGHVVRYNVSIAEDGKEGRVFNEIRNDSFYFEFYERNCDTAYKISINAETRAGYNETLDLNEISIPLQYEVLIPSEDFAMIALGKHEVHVFLQSMADKYTAVWCKWNNNRCIESLNWKEIDMFSNNSTIDLKKAKIYDYRFGMIRESKNGSLSSIQWTDCIYNNSSDPEPPEMIIKEKTTRSVELHLKKRPCHNYAKVGYAFRYQILVSNLKREVLQNLTLSGSDDRIIVHDLEPGTEYNFKVASVTMFGSLSEKSVNEPASTLPRPYFSENWHIGLIAFFGIIILCLIVGGLYACYRCNLDIIKRMKRWFKIGIDPPPKHTVREDGDGNTSSGYKLPRLFDDHLHKAEINVGGERDWPEYKILLRLDTTPTESETTLSGSETSSTESEFCGDPTGTKTNSNEHSNKSTSSVRLSTYGGENEEPEDESESYSKCMYQTNHSNMEFTVPEGPPLEFPPYDADGSDELHPPTELGPRARSDPLGELGPAEDLGPTDINMNRSRCPADISQGRYPVSFDQLTWPASVSLCLGSTEDAQQHCPNDGFDVNSNFPGIRIARYPAGIDSTRRNESENSSWPHVVRDGHDDDDDDDGHDGHDDDRDGVHNMTDETGSNDTDSCDLEMDEYTHAKIHVEDGERSSSTDVDSEHGSYSRAFPSQGVESSCFSVSSDDEDSAEYSRTSFQLLNES